MTGPPLESPGPRSIPWPKRLEAKVLIATVAVAGLSLALVLLLTSRIISTASMARTIDDLEIARTAFNRLVETRTAVAAAQTRLITNLPTFRAHLTDARILADEATVRAMAEGFRQDLSASFCFVTDARGRRIASPGWPEGVELPASLQADIASAVGGRGAKEIVAVNDQLFLVVSEPARFADEILGSLSAGYRLDDRMAKELADVTQCEVSFATHGQLEGSSLTSAVRSEVAKELLDARAIDDMRRGPVMKTIGPRRYVAGVYALSNARSNAGELVLLRDWGTSQGFLDRLKDQLLMLGLATFLFAILGSLVVSRQMAQPLRRLVAATEEIAAGAWDRRVPVEGAAEARALAEAFNRMTNSLSHWHSEANAQTERLQASNRRFHAVTESANDAIVSSDASGNIVFWNDRARSIFGYTAEEAIGQPLTLVMPERHRRQHAIGVERYQKTGESVIVGRTIELSGLRRDGTEFPLELSLSKWTSGSEVFFTGLIRDVTEKKQAADTLRQRDEQLRQAQKMEAVGRLAGGVAHDFNNMLTVINSYADILVDEAAHESVRGPAEEIRRAGERAANLTRQLLAFSRRQVVAPHALDVGRIAEGMVSMLQSLLGEQIQIVVKIGPDLGVVLADTGQIEQILMNLAVNARDAMPHGGKLTIECRNAELLTGRATGSPARHVAIYTTDTGCGMDSETLSHVFEPFFTTKEPGKGTGLGLATVYGIVQQNGGQIEVTSRVNEGTTFKVYFPRVEQPAENTGPHMKPQPARRLGTETVLLVEDEDMVRRLIKGVLERHGYLVLEAGRPEEAVEIASSFDGHIHLLLTDVVMPGMSGRILSERLAPARTDMRVLFMSGYTDDEVVNHGIQQSNAHFIQKPFSLEALAAKVRETIRDSRQSIVESPSPNR